MKAKQKSGTIQLPGAVWEFLDQAAKRENRSVSAVVRSYISYGLKNIILDKIENTKVDSLKSAPRGFIYELCNYLAIAGHASFTMSTDPARLDATRKELMHYFIDNPEIFKETLASIKYSALTQDDVSLVGLWSDEVSE